MAPTVQYLFTALTSLLNNAFDPIARFSSRNKYKDHEPPFHQGAILSERADDDPWKQVRNMLQIQDRSALSSEVAADRVAFEDSGEVTDLLHGMGCEQRCTWPGHHDWLNELAAPDFSRYCVEWEHTPDNYLGMGVQIPQQVPEPLRRALLMHNLCEWAVVILRAAVEAIVKQIDSNAQVLLMLVVPRRHIQLLVADNGTFACTHAVLLIISPLAGNFILDPTAEQYGFPREHRFLPWSIYKERYVVDATRFRGAAVWSTRFGAYMKSLQESENWPFWDSVKTELDLAIAAWLKDCDIRAAEDDDEYWNTKCESLEEMIGQRLADLYVGAAF